MNHAQKVIPAASLGAPSVRWSGTIEDNAGSIHLSLSGMDSPAAVCPTRSLMYVLQRAFSPDTQTL